MKISRGKPFWKSWFYAVGKPIIPPTSRNIADGFRHSADYRWLLENNFFSRFHAATSPGISTILCILPEFLTI